MTHLSDINSHAPAGNDRLSRVLRIVGLILSSVYFFPISCTTTIVPTIHVIAALDARDLSDGDEPFGRTFNVLIYTPSKTPSLSVESLETLEQYEELKALKETFPNLPLRLPDNSTFLLPDKEGMLPGDDHPLSKSERRNLPEDYSEQPWDLYKYTVNQLAPSKQLIDVWYHDDDDSFLSRYMTEKGSITPVYAKRMVPGFMFGAFPYALGFAFLIRGGGVVLVRRNTSKHDKEKVRVTDFPNFLGGVAFLIIALVGSWDLFI